MSEQSSRPQAEVDVDANRHRDLAETLSAILDHDRFPDAQVDRFEIGFQASGEVAVRWRELGSEETDGFVMPSE